MIIIFLAARTNTLKVGSLEFYYVHEARRSRNGDELKPTGASHVHDLDDSLSSLATKQLQETLLH